MFHVPDSLEAIHETMTKICASRGLDEIPRCPECGKEATNLTLENGLREIATVVEGLPVFGTSREYAPTGERWYFMACCGKTHVVHHVDPSLDPPPGKVWVDDYRDFLEGVERALNSTHRHLVHTYKAAIEIPAHVKELIGEIEIAKRSVLEKMGVKFASPLEVDASHCPTCGFSPFGIHQQPCPQAEFGRRFCTVCGGTVAGGHRVDCDPVLRHQRGQT